MNSIQIRNLETIEELERVRQLEAVIWSMEDSVPVNQTAAAVKNGGLVIGAFLNEKLVGFQYSFPGFDGKKVYLCSHSLGIHPHYQKKGIGEALKLAQKKLALAKGYDLITWTYDPLETVNGYLNLHKLGAVCSTYIENAYGEMDDNLNAGIPTDRFLVEWEVGSNHRVEPVQVCGAPRVISTSKVGDFILPEKIDLSPQDEVLLVPVPWNFQEMKRDNLALAIKWREVTREVFQHYLRSKWLVVDLVKDQGQYFYVVRSSSNGD